MADNWQIPEEAIITVIDKSMSHQHVRNPFSRHHALDVKCFNDGRYQVVLTSTHLYLVDTEGDEDDLILMEGTILSMDHTNAEIYFAVRDDSVYKFQISEKPCPIPVFPTLSIKQVACGTQHALFLTTNCNVYALGKGPEVGLGPSAEVTEEPKQIPGLNEVISIHAGNRHSIAVKRKEKAVCDQTKIFRKKKNRIKNRKNSTQSINLSASMRRSSEFEVDRIITMAKPYTEKLLQLKTMPFSNDRRATDSEAIHTFKSSHEDLNNEVYVWGSSAQYQLGLGNTEDQPAPILLNDLDNVVEVACGSRHSAAVNTEGKLYVWGKYDKHITAPKPMEVQYDLDADIVHVACGDEMTMMIIQLRDDEKPHVALVAQENQSSAILQPLQIQEDKMILHSISCSRVTNKGVAIFEPEFERPQNDIVCRQLYGFSYALKRSLKILHVIKQSFVFNQTDSEEMPFFIKGLQNLIDKAVLVLNSSIALAQYISNRTTRLPYDERIEERLIVLIDDHRQIVEDYWTHLYNLQAFNAFEIIQKRWNNIYSRFIQLTNERKMDKTFFAELKLSGVPDLTLLHPLVMLLESIKNDEIVTDLRKKIQDSSIRLLEIKNCMSVMKEVMPILDDTLVEILYSMGGQYILIGGPSAKPGTQKGGDPLLSALNVPVKIKMVDNKPSSASFPSDEAQLLVLKRESIILIFKDKKTSGYRCYEWALKSVWIAISSEGGLKLVTPEITFTLTTHEKQDFERWRNELKETHDAYFQSGPLDMSYTRNVESRKFIHRYMFGPFEENIYDGEWFLGKPHGFGKLRKPGKDGEMYVGEFDNGLYKGLGFCRVYHLNEDDTALVEERCGNWTNNILEGFGISQTHHYEKKGQKFVKTSGVHIGHYHLDKRNGYGIYESGEDIYMGNFKDDEKSGKAFIISYKDHIPIASIIEVDEDGVKRVTGENSEIKYSYTGEMNAQNVPDGKGELIEYISPNSVFKYQGTMIMESAGSFKFRNVTRKIERVKQDRGSHIFNEDSEMTIQPRTIRRTTAWNNLVEQCSSAFRHISFPTDKNLKELAPLIWQKVMSEMLSTLPTYKSDKACLERTLQYFVSLIESDKFTNEQLKKMKELVQNLYLVEFFPIKVFIDVRKEHILEKNVGISMSCETPLQKAIIQDFNDLVVEVYALTRCIFPALPEDIHAKITKENENETYQGYDFAYACLPEDIYFLFMDIVNRPFQRMDDQFFNGSEGAAEIFLRRIPNKNIQDAVKREIELLGQSDHSRDDSVRFVDCINELQSAFYATNTSRFDSEEAFQKLKVLEQIFEKIEEILEREIGTKVIGCENVISLLTYVIERAKPCRFGFWLSYICKLTNHRINASSPLTFLMTSFYAAYADAVSKYL